MGFNRFGNGHAASSGVAESSNCPWVLVERKVIGADVNIVTFSNLNGDADEFYKFEHDIIGGATAVHGDAIMTRFNGLPGGPNFSTSMHYRTGTATSAGPTPGGGDNNPFPLSGPGPGVRGRLTGYILARSGGQRIIDAETKLYHGTANSRLRQSATAWWADTVTVITSIPFAANSGGNTFGAGSILRLLKLVTA